MKQYKKPIIIEEKIELEDIIAASAEANSITGRMWDKNLFQDNANEQ